jgi:hypothetical protein
LTRKQSKSTYYCRTNRKTTRIPNYVLGIELCIASFVTYGTFPFDIWSILHGNPISFCKAANIQLNGTCQLHVFRSLFGASMCSSRCGDCIAAVGIISPSRRYGELQQLQESLTFRGNSRPLVTWIARRVLLLAFTLLLSV